MSNAIDFGQHFVPNMRHCGTRNTYIYVQINVYTRNTFTKDTNTCRDLSRAVVSLCLCLRVAIVAVIVVVFVRGGAHEEVAEVDGGEQGERPVHAVQPRLVQVVGQPPRRPPHRVHQRRAQVRPRGDEQRRHRRRRAAQRRRELPVEQRRVPRQVQRLLRAGQRQLRAEPERRHRYDGYGGGGADPPPLDERGDGHAGDVEGVAEPDAAERGDDELAVPERRG
uniref:Uncharacterized protein n=1 Tax=Oryza brachyantha TaxID=4533 RepID=J3L834_ORYBR